MPVPQTPTTPRSLWACGRDRVPLRPRLLASQAGDDASTKETASSSALISQSAIVLYVPTPQLFGYWQAAACPRAARKSATYRSPRSPYWQPWCRRSAQMTLQIGFGSRAGAMNAYVSPNGEAIQVRALQWPCLITSVKINPTCAVSNTAGTRLRKTAPSLLDLFRVSRSASAK